MPTAEPAVEEVSATGKTLMTTDLTMGEEDTPDEPTEDGDEVAGESDDDTSAGGDATGPSVDTDTDPEGGLIELAGFGSPVSLVAVGVLAVILSLSYAFRLKLVAGGLVSNMGGSE